ncbi:hypothetical protein [Flavobacterium sp.]|uniref:hypothetical protein n=1 Tax=Flavobacterium sp. TaxID=239 RepID=UPI00391E00CF
MSNLFQKSKFNIDAAEELIKKSLHAPSVHCSYYACFQFLKFTLKNFQNLTYDYIESECRIYPGGTHGYIIDNCLNEFRKKVDFSKFKDIKRELKDLKDFRIDSDYYDKEIIIDESEKCLALSKNIISEIKKNLK